MNLDIEDQAPNDGNFEILKQNEGSQQGCVLGNTSHIESHAKNVSSPQKETLNTAKQILPLSKLVHDGKFLVIDMEY